MDHKPFVAAALQMTPVFMDKRATVEKLCAWIEEAGRQGVEFLVTPETVIPGYPYWRGNFGYMSQESAQEWRDVVLATYHNAVRIPSPETDRLCHAAQRANSYVVVGLQEQDDRPGSATLYNTMLFIDRRGEIMGRHRKLIPTHQERSFWGSGNASDLRVFDTDLGRVGGLVCFENHVTLFKAAMAAKGEELHAANWPGYWTYTGERRNVRDLSGRPGPYHLSDQDSALREYAFETQTFVVSAGTFQPRDAVPDSFPFKTRSALDYVVGGSCIINPFGMYLVEPVFNRETLVVAELDPNDRIIAKNIFDCMGHYTRWDVVSLNLREHGWEPLAQPAARRPEPPGTDGRDWSAKLEQVAERHGIDPERLEAALRELL